jgi:hypothetical protein
LKLNYYLTKVNSFYFYSLLIIICYFTLDFTYEEYFRTQSNLFSTSLFIDEIGVDFSNTILIAAESEVALSFMKTLLFIREIVSYIPKYKFFTQKNN